MYNEDTIIVDIRRFNFFIRRQRRRYRTSEKIIVESDVSRNSDDEFNDFIDVEFG